VYSVMLIAISDGIETFLSWAWAKRQIGPLLDGFGRTAPGLRISVHTVSDPFHSSRLDSIHWCTWNSFRLLGTGPEQAPSPLPKWC
jgi:hypothetical protein